MKNISRSERVPEYAIKLDGPSFRLSILRTRSQATTPSSGRSHGHSRSSSSLSATADSDAMVIFRVRSSDADSSSEEVSQLVEWINSLPSQHRFRSDWSVPRSINKLNFSTTPWALWTMLDGLDGWELVCETFGRNRLGQFPRD